MRRTLIYMFAAVSIMAAVSCSKDSESQEYFIEKCLDGGLVIANETIFDYDENTCQMAFNESALQYRVSNDTMSDFYVLDCNRRPGEVGSTLKATLTWSTDVDVRQRSGLEFKVIRAQGDWFWLWNRKNDIGVVVREAK